MANTRFVFANTQGFSAKGGLTANGLKTILVNADVVLLCEVPQIAFDNHYSLAFQNDGWESVVHDPTTSILAASKLKDNLTYLPHADAATSVETIFKRVMAFSLDDYFVVVAHFPASQHPPASRMSAARFTRRIIEQIRQQNGGTANIILVGDFNDNPFDESILTLNGLGASYSRRKYNPDRYKAIMDNSDVLFNPMWHLIGKHCKNDTKAGGTYRYGGVNSRLIPTNVNFFDQVMFAHHLLPRFVWDDFTILHIPAMDACDHNPIRFTFTQPKLDLL